MPLTRGGWCLSAAEVGGAASSAPPVRAYTACCVLTWRVPRHGQCRSQNCSARRAVGGRS